MATLDSLNLTDDEANAADAARMLEMEPDCMPVVVPERYRIDPETEPTGWELVPTPEQIRLWQYEADYAARHAGEKKDAA